MMQELAEFQKLFPEIPVKPFEAYLSDINKETLIKLATHLIGSDLYSSEDEDSK